MSEPWVGPAPSSDLVAVAAINDHWLGTRTATFDVMEPPLSWRQAKLDSTDAGDTSWWCATTTGCPDLSAAGLSVPAPPTY
jgi:hypothetical protein